MLLSESKIGGTNPCSYLKLLDKNILSNNASNTSRLWNRLSDIFYQSSEHCMRRPYSLFARRDIFLLWFVLFENYNCTVTSFPDSHFVTHLSFTTVSGYFPLVQTPLSNFGYPSTTIYRQQRFLELRTGRFQPNFLSIRFLPLP